MARTISDIKKTMTDAFMAEPVIREKYGLAESDKFEDAFSVVSLESILFYIVASCCHILECFFDAHTKDVDVVVNKAVVASVAWYHKMALQFQYGDEMQFDPTTSQFIYPVTNSSKQLVKYVAIRDRGTSIQMLVSGEKGGMPEPLPNDVLTAFKYYMNTIKIAGVVIAIRSLPADKILIDATIKVNPMVIDRSGKRISDGTKAVEIAISNYLKNILYGGTFNKTQLVDAIQKVPGVIDVELGNCSYSQDGTHFHSIAGNNYTSEGGSFVAEGLNNSLYYVV